MRVLALLVALVGCQVSAPPPARSVRLEDRPEAKAYRERKNEQEREAVEKQRARNDEWKLKAAEENAAQETRTAQQRYDRGPGAQEAKCSGDREERRERWKRVEDERAENTKRVAAIESWMEKHCRKTVVGEFVRRLCDDGSSVAKVCNVRVGEHDEYACPAGAPSGVTKTGVEHTQVYETKASEAAAADMRKNIECSDTGRAAIAAPSSTPDAAIAAPKATRAPTASEIGRVRGGRASIEEVRSVKEACAQLHDLACLDDIKNKYP